MSTEDAYGVELDRRLAAEQALAAVVEVVEAYESCGPKQQSTRDVLAAVRAALEGAALHGLDNCAQAPAQVLRDAALFFEREMSRAWGGDAQWLTTGTHVAGVVADVLREEAADLDAERVAGVRRELSEEPCPACGGSMRFCECMDDPFAPAGHKCPTCAHPEGYDRLSGPCPTCQGAGGVVTPRCTSGGPDPADVGTLRGLLDLMADFPDNDQRARYLLTSNWMRDKLAGDQPPFHCYPCARGDHGEHKVNAWEPGIPCECPPCTIPYQHGPHLVDDGRLQVRCPGGGANA